MRDRAQIKELAKFQFKQRYGMSVGAALLFGLLAVGNGTQFRFGYEQNIHIPNEWLAPFFGILFGFLSVMFLVYILIGAPLSFVYDTPVTAANILYIVLLGVVQLGIPYILFSLSAKYCSALTCSLLSVLEPLFNPIWVFLVLGEQPGAYALIGGAVVLLTITLWCVWDGRQKQAACPAQTAEV